MPKYSVVLSDGGNLDRLKVSLTGAYRCALEGGKHLTFFVPTMKHAPDSIMGELFGSSIVKKLIKDKFVSNGTCSFSIVSGKTIKPLREKGVVLGLWCDQDMMNKLDQCINAHDVVALSWEAHEMADWANQREAELL